MELLDLVTPQDAVEFLRALDERGPYTRDESQKSVDKLKMLALAMTGQDVELARQWGPALTVLDDILKFKTRSVQ